MLPVAWQLELVAQVALMMGCTSAANLMLNPTQGSTPGVPPEPPDPLLLQPAKNKIINKPIKIFMYLDDLDRKINRIFSLKESYFGASASHDFKISSA